MEFSSTLISCSGNDSHLRRKLENAEAYLVSLENGTSMLLEEMNLDPHRRNTNAPTAPGRQRLKIL